MSTLQRLTDRGLIRPPRWLPGSVQYETIMGSVAYGVSSDTSDMDVYGWAIPPKDDVFPHLRGEIPGFGTPRPGSNSTRSIISTTTTPSAATAELMT